MENFKPGIVDYLGPFTGPGVVPAPEALTGTITTVGDRVTGVDTLFERELQVGQFLYANGEVRQIEYVRDNTYLKLKRAFTADVAALVINDATNATPIVITTTTDHGLLTGQKVTISEVEGNTAANGTFTITRVTDTTFSLDDSVGNGAYTEEGSVAIHPAMSRPDLFRHIGIKNSGDAAGTLFGNSLPSGEGINFNNDAGVSPVAFDATGTTFLISTLE